MIEAVGAAMVPALRRSVDSIRFELDQVVSIAPAGIDANVGTLAAPKNSARRCKRSSTLMILMMRTWISPAAGETLWADPAGLSMHIAACRRVSPSHKHGFTQNHLPDQGLNRSYPCRPVGSTAAVR
jgi:hypothetical protein